MKELTISYKVGTVKPNLEPDEREALEAYCEELEARFAESFPEVARICVELEEDLGVSLASVKGLDKSEHEKEAAMHEQIEQIADAVWERGKWNA